MLILLILYGTVHLCRTCYDYGYRFFAEKQMVPDIFRSAVQKHRSAVGKNPTLYMSAVTHTLIIRASALRLFRVCLLTPDILLRYLHSPISVQPMRSGNTADRVWDFLFRRETSILWLQTILLQRKDADTITILPAGRRDFVLTAQLSFTVTG